MHATDALFFLWKTADSACPFLTGATGFHCVDPVDDAMEHGTRPPLPSNSSNPIELLRLESALELMIAGLGFLGTIALVVNYVRYNRRRRSKWKTEQTNICIIPFAIAVTFVVIYYLSR